MTSPPRTIRSRSLHASIRDVSGVSVAKALAGNTRSIVEGVKDSQNAASILRDKLIHEYTLRATQLKNSIVAFSKEKRLTERIVLASFKEIVSDLFAATDAVCDSIQSLNGKDLSVLKSYCNLVGLELLGFAMKHTIRIIRFDIPNFEKVYLSYLLKGHVFNIDLESLKELAGTVASACIADSLPFPPASIITEAEPDALPRPPLSHMVARKSGAPHPVNPKKKQKKQEPHPTGLSQKAPEPVFPPEPVVRRSPRIGSSEATRESESPTVYRRRQDVSRSPVRTVPASPAPAPPARQQSPPKEQKSQLLREAMKAIKEAAVSGTSPAGSKSSPPKKDSRADIDQKLADFANMVAYIHEPFDPATDTAIKNARQLKAILKAELDAVEQQMNAGEFFTQV